MTPRVPLGILYDQTHDNPSYFEREDFFNCLPLIAEMSFSNCFLGSVRGFDEFYPKKLSVFPINGMVYKTITEIIPKKVSSESDMITVRICYQAEKKLKGSMEIRGDWDKWSNGTHFKY